METYKQASRLKLRFQTDKGNLSTEQLWDLSLNSLDSLAIQLETEHEKSGKKSFLTKASKEDKISKLKFDIVIDVLNTKIEENQIALDASAKKEHDSVILGLIAEKKNEVLKGKSIEELQALLNK